MRSLRVRAYYAQGCAHYAREINAVIEPPFSRHCTVKTPRYGPGFPITVNHGPITFQSRKRSYAITEYPRLAHGTFAGATSALVASRRAFHCSKGL